MSNSTLGRPPSSSPSSTSLPTGLLSLPQLVAQGVAVMTPSGGAALGLAVVFGLVGPSGWIVYIIGTLIVFMVSLELGRLSAGWRSAGGPSAAILHYFGRLPGLVCSWGLLTAYAAGAIATAAACGGYLSLAAIGHLPSPSVSVAVSSGAVFACWLMARAGIGLSTSIMLLIEFTTISLVLLLLIETADPADIRHALLRSPDIDMSALLFAVVLIITGFAGFESSTTLSIEAKTFKNILERSTLISVVIVGLFFSLSAVLLLAAFHGDAEGLAALTAPLNELANRHGRPWQGQAIAAGAALSFFAGALGCINASARLLHDLSSSGYVSASFARIHGRRGTPHVGIDLFAAFTLVGCVAAIGYGMEPKDLFGPLGAFSGVGFIICYLLVCGASIRNRIQERNHVLVIIPTFMSMLALLLALGGLFIQADPNLFLFSLSVIALLSILLLSLLSHIHRRVDPAPASQAGSS